MTKAIRRVKYNGQYNPSRSNLSIDSIEIKFENLPDNSIVQFDMDMLDLIVDEVITNTSKHCNTIVPEKAERSASLTIKECLNNGADILVLEFKNIPRNDYNFRKIAALWSKDKDLREVITGLRTIEDAV